MKRERKNGRMLVSMSLAVLALVCLTQGASARENPSGSSTWNGRTTNVRGEANGSRTRTTTDHRTGRTTTSNSAKDPVGGSSRNPFTGETTSSYQNPNGTRTVTVTDEAGSVISKRIEGQAKPAPKPPVLIIHGRITPAKPAAGCCAPSAPVTPRVAPCAPVTPRAVPLPKRPVPSMDPGDPRSWDNNPVIIIL
jgi:hypothetical protein